MGIIIPRKKPFQVEQLFSWLQTNSVWRGIGPLGGDLTKHHPEMSDIVLEVGQPQGHQCSESLTWQPQIFSPLHKHWVQIILSNDSPLVFCKKRNCLNYCKITFQKSLQTWICFLSFSYASFSCPPL